MQINGRIYSNTNGQQQVSTISNTTLFQIFFKNQNKNRHTTLLLI